MWHLITVSCPLSDIHLLCLPQEVVEDLGSMEQDNMDVMRKGGCEVWRVGCAV